ncbi:PPA1309 family protein [uncultured Corynebacterium sp.]|uniref:PPA1309 family protein n=1 Tax=uncultured Corynebacterium sp. TaxID=159447 RepID=UPI0025E434FE|nr:PPA1309 family protein [uncultured Corynebacterium sp.]
MPDARALSPQALNRAVREAVDFVHAEGWDAPPTLFALVPTELVADALDPELLDESPLTVVVQEELPEGIDGGSPELSDFIARTTWPDGVVGAVLAQEILIVAPEDADAVEGLSLDEIRASADGAARQARLFTGVLDDGPSLTLIQPRPTEAELAAKGPFAEDDVELRAGDGLADGVVGALQSTFQS